MTDRRILVAGVGNVLLGDDGFGVEVARRLAGRDLPRGVCVRDFGIRGFDLALALLEGYDQVVLIDAVRRGERPGTLYLMEAADDPNAPGEFQVHGMVPSQVFRAVRSMGGVVRNVFVVACEPEDLGDPDGGRIGLSASVEASVGGALGMVEDLIRRSPEGREAHA